MEIIRLTDASSAYFHTICEWNYQWWGAPRGKSRELVDCFMAHCLCTGERLPQTFVAVHDGHAEGMYQLSMSDDLESRPDLYPWLINVYVGESYRHRGVCRRLLESVPVHAKALGLRELYLYTKHIGLYEKFGWDFVEFVNTFDETSPQERLYRLSL